MTFEGPVKREDLNLRGRYIEIKTTIYKVNTLSYYIYVENAPGDFETFKDDFAKFKIVGTPVSVVNEKPQDYEAIIPGITDKEIATNFEGMPVTLMDIFSILLSKFPNVYFKNISQTGRDVIITTYAFKEKINDTIYARYLNNGDRNKIVELIENFKSSFSVQIIEEEVETLPENTTLTFDT